MSARGQTGVERGAPDPDSSGGEVAGRASRTLDEEELTFSRAVASDVGDIVELVEASFRGDGSGAGWTTELHLVGGPRTSPDEVASMIGAAESEFVVARLEGALVGCCRLDLTHAPTAFFGMFAVRPAAQGRGLGARVLDEVERIARYEHGANRLAMYVLSGRPELVAWYDRRGYRPTGQSHPFAELAHGGQPLVDDLEFRVYEKVLTGAPPS